MAVDPTIITEDDIRLFLIDKTGDDNYLLQDQEYTPEEIAKAHGLAIDKFNSTLPLIQLFTEIPRYEAILGTAAILLRMRAINFTRNRLDYTNKNGTAVQDKNKGPEYLTLAREFAEEFDQRAKALKVHLNIEACYGRIGSYYSLQGFHW
jgi:hypothetical protein